MALHLATIFPGLSTAKLNEGIFVGTQIRENQKCTVLDGPLTSKELRVWKAFKSVCSVEVLLSGNNGL